MALLALISALSLAATAEAHGGLRSGRSLFSYSQVAQHIWGRCDQLDRGMTGCSLGSDVKCMDHLSDGPDDADVEIHLGNLPPSTIDEEVHLQWWSPRRSPTRYEPLVSPLGVTVYRCMADAYAKFFEPHFNGGNVRVSENGTAVIRVRAPATYFVWKYLAVPHIHLRLCRGESFAQNVSDAFYFGLNDTWVSTGSQESEIQVLATRPYNATAPKLESPTIPRPEAVIVSIIDNRERTTSLDPSTTTLAPVASSTTPLEPNTSSLAPVASSSSSTTPEATTPSTTPEATTPEATTPQPTPTEPEDPARGATIDAARDALDLDALEFSPVYLCLLEEQFFDHFTSDCVESCAQDAALVNGQCVRQETEESPVSLQATWKLEVQCGQRCWHDKKNQTLHNIRLSIAGLLDVPFQEVEQVSVSFLLPSDGRRLSAFSSTRTGYLEARVSTRRVRDEVGKQMLDGYLEDAAFASQLLGMDVRSVEQVVTGSVEITDANSETLIMGTDNDPYAPAYDEAANTAGDPTSPGASSVLGFLPTAAIVGIACGVVVLGVFFGLFIWYRRRQQARGAPVAQGNKAVEGKAVDGEAVGGKAVEEPQQHYEENPAAVAEAAPAAVNEDGPAGAEASPAAVGEEAPAAVKMGL